MKKFKQYVDEGLTPDQKKNINIALGSRTKNNPLRKTSASARALIGLAKSNKRSTDGTGHNSGVHDQREGAEVPKNVRMAHDTRPAEKHTFATRRAWVGDKVENSQMAHDEMHKAFVAKFGAKHKEEFHKHVSAHVD